MVTTGSHNEYDFLHSKALNHHIPDIWREIDCFYHCQDQQLARSNDGYDSYDKHLLFH